jgi:hypothetical protein
MSKKHIHSFLTVVQELYRLMIGDDLYGKYGENSILIYESMRSLVIDWTIPKISSKDGKQVVKRLQQYNIWSFNQIYKTNILSRRLKIKIFAFYVDCLGFYLIKFISKAGQYVK